MNIGLKFYNGNDTIVGISIKVKKGKENSIAFSYWKKVGKIKEGKVKENIYRALKHGLNEAKHVFSDCFNDSIPRFMFLMGTVYNL